MLDAAIAPPHLGTVRVGERHVHLDLAPGVTMQRPGDAAAAFTSGALVDQPRQRRMGVAGPAVAAGDPARRRSGGAARGRQRIAAPREVRRPPVVRAARLARAAGDVHALPEGHEDHDRQRAERDLAGGRGRPRRVHGRRRHATRSTRSTTRATCSSSSATRRARTRPTRPAASSTSRSRRTGSWTVDFNRAYNPPCAFSAYTSCPLPPKQNVLAPRIDAGEKFRGH